MAELVFNKCRFLIGTSGAPTTTLAKKVRSVTISYNAEIQDKTAMGANSRQRLSGIKDWNMAVEFNQDFATSDFDKFMFAKVGDYSTNCWIQVSPTSAKGGATNPRYCGRTLAEGYSPISGAVGDLATYSVTFQGDGDLSRLVTTGPKP
ncbi:MAG: phage tail protein [Magnetococcus sp. WYHC-3]